MLKRAGAGILRDTGSGVVFTLHSFKLRAFVSVIINLFKVTITFSSGTAR